MQHFSLWLRRSPVLYLILALLLSLAFLQAMTSQAPQPQGLDQPVAGETVPEGTVRASAIGYFVRSGGRWVRTEQGGQ